MNTHKLFKQTKHPLGMSDYFHAYNLSNILGDIYWKKLFEKTEDVDGDIVECGVGRGRSLITLLSLNLYYKMTAGSSRCVYALDSFEGFPEPAIEDVSQRNPQKGDWSISPNGDFKYSVENLERILASAGLDVPFCKGIHNSYLTNPENLKIFKGFFDQTTANLPVKRISILHLDGDLYNSVKIPLLNLSSKISTGGIVVVDDFLLRDINLTQEAFPGARTAVMEFLSENNDFVLEESIRGTPVLVKVK